jgi:hypothetical protein
MEKCSQQDVNGVGHRRHITVIIRLFYKLQHKNWLLPKFTRLPEYDILSATSVVRYAQTARKLLAASSRAPLGPHDAPQTPAGEGETPRPQPPRRPRRLDSRTLGLDIGV